MSETRLHRRNMHMTKHRVVAIWEAAGRGVDEWEAELSDLEDSNDPQDKAEARILRTKRDSALQAMDVLRQQYAYAFQD